MKNHNKKLIPLSEPDLQLKDIKYVKECIMGGWVSSSGPLVEKFEKKLLSFCNRKEAIAVINGSSALLIAIKSLNLPKGSLVVVPDWTFVATVNAIIHAGLEPIFIDINNHNWCINEEQLEICLKKYKKRISAVLFVNALGNMPDIKKLKKLSKVYRFSLIEDAAGALGSKKGNYISGSNGDLSIFSFNGNKTLTTGGGGAVLTNKAYLSKKIRYLITQARDGLNYTHGDVGYNFKMPNLNAALGLAQAEKLRNMIKRKQSIAKIYYKFFKKNTMFTFMPVHSFSEHSCWMSCLKFNKTKDLLSLKSYLQKRNIVVRPFWNSLSRQKPFKKYLRMKTIISGSLSNKVLSLPSSSNLKKNEQIRVINEIISWYKDNN